MTNTHPLQTLDTRQDKRDIGREAGKFLASRIGRMFKKESYDYTAVDADELQTPLNSSFDVESAPRTPNTPRSNSPQPAKPKAKPRLPWSRIWTRNVLFTLLLHLVQAFHVGTFNNLWFVFLSTPRFNPEKPRPDDQLRRHLPFIFTGGLGMPPASVGLAMAVLGVIGISLQLLVYPWVTEHLGTLRSYRTFLPFFVLAYTVVPYLAIVPSSSPPPHRADGFLVWISLAGVLFVQVTARTFALPATVILINNCSPHPSVLGTVHGIAQSVSSAARTAGPMLGGWLYGVGLKKGVVGGVWWGLAAVAVVGLLCSALVYEGSGHEILLPGEVAEDENAEVVDTGRNGAKESH